VGPEGLARGLNGCNAHKGEHKPLIV